MATKKMPEHGLRETKGTFQIKGLTVGKTSKNFFTEKDFGTSKMRSVSFGITYEPDKTIFETLQGFTRPKVYFSKKDKDGKTVTKDVDWANRLTFATQNPAYRIIGANIGLTKDDDDNNIKEYLAEYDAAASVKEKMVDGMSVFTRGNLTFRSYKTEKDGVRRLVNFEPTQISLCSAVDFEDEEFTSVHDWEQEVIFTGIEQEEEKGQKTGRFIFEGYVVSFTSVEPVSFIVTDKALATKIRKGLKPFQSIKVYGKIEIVHLVDNVEVEEEEEDAWGETNNMDNKRVNAPTKREMIITGATPSTISNDFSEESVSKALKFLANKSKTEKSFGETKKEDDAAPWGDDNSSSDLEDDWD